MLVGVLYAVLPLACGLPGSWRYMRMKNNAGIGSTTCTYGYDLKEVEIRDTSDAGISITVDSHACGHYSTYVATKACDGSTSTYWWPDTCDMGTTCWDASKIGIQWIIFDAGSSSPTWSKIRYYSASASFFPSSMSFECSNDKVTWGTPYIASTATYSGWNELSNIGTTAPTGPTNFPTVSPTSPTISPTSPTVSPTSPTVSPTVSPSHGPHDYLAKLGSYSCSGGTSHGTGLTDAACQAYCDASDSCYVWQQKRTACGGTATCYTHTYCTPATGASSCNELHVRATSVTSEWSVGCASSTTPCCTTVGNCFRTPNYPSDYSSSAYCIASFTGGTLSVTGDLEATYDKVYVITTDTTYSAVGMNEVFTLNQAHGFLQFTSDSSVVKMGSEICKTASPTASPTTGTTPPPSVSPVTSTPSLSPTVSPTTSTPSVSPTAPPSTSVPTTSPTVPPTTTSPSVSPSAAPLTSVPTVSPSTPLVTPPPSTSPLTSVPSTSPTTSTPTTSPTVSPTTSVPTDTPSTTSPSVSPSAAPLTSVPTVHPSTPLATPPPSTSPLTSVPSVSPSAPPSTSVPTISPTVPPTTTSPTVHPSTPLATPPPSTSPLTSAPSISPTTSTPTTSPTVSPTTSVPTVSPSTTSPSVSPTAPPSTS
eukprot:Hpha_TRINITY_DN15178_c4_g1::TRINITY_DN15178_c4_g1_i4::g.129714::m.129714